MSRRERVEDDEEEQRLTKPRRGFLRQTGRLRPRSPEVDEFQPRMRFDPIPLYPSLPRYPGSNRGNRRGPFDNLDGDGFNFNPPDFSDASPDDGLLPSDPQEPSTDAANVIRNVVRDKVWNSTVLYSDTQCLDGISVTQTGSAGADEYKTMTYDFHRNVNLNDEFVRSRKIKMNLIQFRGDIYFQQPLYEMPAIDDSTKFLYMNGCLVTVAIVYDSLGSTDHSEEGYTGVDFWNVFKSNSDSYNTAPTAFNVLAPFMMTNPAFKNRFQILFRKTYHLNFPQLDYIAAMSTTGTTTSDTGVTEYFLNSAPVNNLRALRPQCCNRVHFDETIKIDKTLDSYISDLNVPCEYKGRIFPVFVSDYPEAPATYPAIWTPFIRWQSRITGRSLSL